MLVKQVTSDKWQTLTVQQFEIGACLYMGTILKYCRAVHEEGKNGDPQSENNRDHTHVTTATHIARVVYFKYRSCVL